ncbi:MAG TPA: heme-copper oxidase subunit III [Terriglobales bacterium]|nr:heme-copper oxidase subunit III [Terriglobales bacterium]
MEPTPLTSAAASGAPSTGAAAHLAASASAHTPQPSFWPILLAGGIGAVFFLLFLTFLGVPMAGVLLVAAVLYTLVAASGWANTIAVERRRMDRVQTNKDLTRGFFFFLASEAMIFFAYFEYIYYTRFTGTVWPPAGMPKLATSMPAIATLILVGSSFVLNFAVQAFLRGKQAMAKNLLLLTIAMGITFLGFQGFEWGYLNGVLGFTVTTGAFSSAYFIMTGFHAAHVTVGLLMLSLVYWRMEKGEYNNEYHMSMKAAEYYWHFVDIVWILLFFTLYLF